MLDALEDKELNFRFDEKRVFGRRFNKTLNRLRNIFDKERKEIMLMKVSIMMMVTIGKSTLLSLMLSNSKTINRLFKRSNCLSEFKRKSYSPPL